MKKVVALALTAVMSFGLAACGAKEAAPAESSAASTAESVAESSAEESVEESAAESEAASEAESEAAGDLMSATEDGVLTVGFDAEYPPYGYMDDNGEYTGFDLELAQAVCDLEGWELEKKPINWDSKDAELNAYSIDCIWNGFTMNGREDDYTFSVPYVNNSQVIVVSSESGIKTLDDLAGKVVGVQQASAALDVLTGEDSDMKELGDSLGEIKQFSDYNTAFTELQAGALDGLAIDIGVAKYQLSTRGEGFEMLDEALNAEEYAVGCRKGDTELADTINADLAKLMEDGTVMELAEKYEIADMISLS